jgi:hypothetical protein
MEPDSGVLSSFPQNHIILVTFPSIFRNSLEQGKVFEMAHEKAHTACMV